MLKFYYNTISAPMNKGSAKVSLGCPNSLLQKIIQLLYLTPQQVGWLPKNSSEICLVASQMMLSNVEVVWSLKSQVVCSLKWSTVSSIQSCKLDPSHQIHKTFTTKWGNISVSKPLVRCYSVFSRSVLKY